MFTDYSRCRWAALVVVACLVTMGQNVGANEEVPAVQPLARTSIYLVAARQKPQITESLELAGVELAPNILATPLLLRVTVGNEKGFSKCGTRNNVKYSLQSDGNTILLLSAAGWTGSCTPSVFYELSRQLARALEDVKGGKQ